MAILNEQDIDKVYFYTSDTPLKVDEVLYSSHKYWFKDLIGSDEKYYIVKTNGWDLFSRLPLEMIMSRELIRSLQLGEINLAVVNTLHGEHTLVNDIYDNIVIKHNINPKNILLTSESYDMVTEIRLVAEKYNLDTIKYKWTTQLEYLVQENLLDFTNTLDKKQYEKKYLSFNGGPRRHRDAIVFLLFSLGLLDYGHVSYRSSDSSEGSGEETYNIIHNGLKYNDTIKGLLEVNKNALVNIEPMYVDGKSNPSYSVFCLGDEHLYNDTYFSVITESHFPLVRFGDGNLVCFTDVGRLLSEKTFKSIKARHPFIMVSNPKTLELMRSIGYKTFHPYIDESYDQIEDDAARLVAIAEEIKRLCEMSEQEVNQFIDNVLPICQYNQKVLNEKTIFKYDLIL